MKKKKRKRKIKWIPGTKMTLEFIVDFADTGGWRRRLNFTNMSDDTALKVMEVLTRSGYRGKTRRKGTIGG